jgi:hypothetical protein
VAIQASGDSEDEEQGDELDGLLALATASELAWNLEPDTDVATSESNSP